VNFPGEHELTQEQLAYLDLVETTPGWLMVNVPMLAIELSSVLDALKISGESFASVALAVSGELKRMLMDNDPDMNTRLGLDVGELGAHLAICAAITTRQKRGKEPL
jgi:hypothetical protein